MRQLSTCTAQVNSRHSAHTGSGSVPRAWSLAAPGLLDLCRAPSRQGSREPSRKGSSGHRPQLERVPAACPIKAPSTASRGHSRPITRAARSRWSDARRADIAQLCSQADSAGSIPVTRSTTKPLVRRLGRRTRRMLCDQHAEVRHEVRRKPPAVCEAGHWRSCTGRSREVCTEQKLLVLQRSSVNWRTNFRVLGDRPFMKRKPWLACDRGGMARSSSL
jgi:hypothetical protein